MVFNRGPCLRLDEASCILLRSNLVDYKYMRVSTLITSVSGVSINGKLFKY